MSARLGFSTVLLGIMVAAATAQATPRPIEPSGARHLVSAQNLSDFHLGAFYRDAEREVRLSDGSQYTLDQRKPGFYLAYDVLPWFAVYASLAYTQLALGSGDDTFEMDGDRSAEFGGGAWINLIEHDLVDNLLLESRISLTAQGQFTVCDGSVMYYDLPYAELFGTVTLNVITDIDGNKRYWPEGIGLFVGPVFDSLQSDDFDSQTDEFGALVGLDILLSRRVTLSGSLELHNEEQTVNAAINVRL